MKNRYDFVYIFDCENCNPNGDPLTDNKPRIDPMSGHGIVSDSAIKRRIRDHIIKWKEQRHPFCIHLVPGTNRNDEMYKILGEDPRNPKKEKKSNIDKLSGMLERFWDVRAFGAVLSTGPNMGQVTGPVQIGFSKSVDPIYISDIQMAVCTSAGDNKAKDGSDKENRTFGMKYVVPYGLYVCKGTISTHQKTGFNENDLDVLWKSIMEMWDSNRTHSKMGMNSRMLVIFKHTGSSEDEEQNRTEARMGRCPSWKLFESVKISKKCSKPLEYNDYEIKIDCDFPGIETAVVS